MFKVGQSIVHKSHGVGKIVGIDERDFNNGKGIVLRDCEDEE